MSDEQSRTVYTAVLVRFNNLMSVRNKIIRSQVAECIRLANYLLENHYCQSHFVSVLRETIREESKKHTRDSLSREALEVCLVAIDLAVEDVAIGVPAKTTQG